jgi:hypothetical protein
VNRKLAFGYASFVVRGMNAQKEEERNSLQGVLHFICVQTWNCHAQRSESNAHNCFYDFMLNDCAGTTSVKGTHSGGNLVA